MKRAMFFLAVTCFAANLFAGGQSISVSSGMDWPRFRGPDGDGKVPSEYLELDHGLQGLSQLWSIDVGKGYSAPSVYSGKVYAVGYADGKDTVFCLNESTGKVIWTYEYSSIPGGYTGPFATPTVSGDAVYTLGKEGTIVRLDRLTGKVVWKRNLVSEFGVIPPEWDIAGSVYPYEDLLLINACESGVALNAETGDLIWRSSSSPSGYATPVVAEIHGTHTAVFFGARALYGVSPLTGEVLWQLPWTTPYDVNAADPLVVGNRIFISSNYRRGCALIEIGPNGATIVWENNAASSHFSSFIYHEGFIYGNDGDANAHRGSLLCIDATTGEVAWSERTNIGSVIAVGGTLLILTERRELITADLTSNAYRETSRISVGKKGLYWTGPVVANNKVFIRSLSGQLSAFEL